MHTETDDQAKPERLASPWLGYIPPKDRFSHGTEEELDRAFNAWLGRFTANISLASLWMAYLDWAIHLQLAPAKQQELIVDGWRKLWQWHLLQIGSTALSDNKQTGTVVPLPQDKRFSAEDWHQWPYGAISQGFLLTQQWWHRATNGVVGVSRHHEDVVTFVARQLLDMMSPSNFVLTNPVAMRETIRNNGANLVQGAFNEWMDIATVASGVRRPVPDAYRLGTGIAATPGKVIYRNRLIELIQYSPMTEKVHQKPILFVPAWIMKYYILDLSQENSLVGYLVAHGYTVFMISWKNPEADDRDLTLDDYRQLGVMAAIDAATAASGAQQLNAVGYCLGGTLLAIAAAAMARDGDERLASISLFAAQVDFKEPGELSLFIDESQIAQLEASMSAQGYLDTKQMAGAFQLLRSNDLIWSRRLNQYVLGLPDTQNDLAVWNADATRMPYRMHSEYLRRLFLGNDLAEGRYRVGERTVALTDIRAPIFAVGTLTDHVAPWRSVYKIHLLTDTEVTFLLTTGGHNAGVVSPPGRSNRKYQFASHAHDAPYIDPDTWEITTPTSDGSWWPVWKNWLEGRSGKQMTAPAATNALCNAPGTYVMAA
jgi:polyhydroxyalkanoate synthase subunit PhaC